VPLSRAQEMQERLLATFRGEANDHLAMLGRELDGFDLSASEAELGERLEVLFRTMHTLKGASRSVGHSDIESICHLSEALLRDMRDAMTATPETIRALRDACDAIAGLLGGGLPPERLEDVCAQLQHVPQTAPQRAGAKGSAPLAARSRRARPRTAAPTARVEPAEAEKVVAPAETAAPSTASETTLKSERTTARPNPAGSDVIRVEIDRLDRFSILADELLIPKLAAADRVRMARGLRDALDEACTFLRTSRSRSGAGTEAETRATAAAIYDRLRSAEVASRKMLETLRNDHRIIRTTVDGLLDEMRRIRMVPANHMLEAFPRMVRGLARDTGKNVALQLSGTDVEIDRKIIDVIKDPLIHMVRNAVDHGIESPQDRLQAGKPAEAKISIAVVPTADGRVTISISDDGRGLDTDNLKHAAVRARAISAEHAETLHEDDIIELAFRSGVSTSPVISNISGNGVGLAIVRERVERIEGRLSISTKPGEGSTITLDLPTSVATYRGFLVGAGTEKLLWPFDTIERAISIPHDEAVAGLARGSFAFAEQALPIGRLSDIMGFEAAAAPPKRRRNLPAIVVRGGDRRGILLLEEIWGESEIVLKELRAPLKRIRNVMTAGLLGTGELVLVARPSDVLASIHIRACEPSSETARSAVRAQRILIVDDSITTRTMERNMFESAGYQVKAAADGVEALSLLQSEEFDLVVSDVDMPRMDGFELTQHVRANAKLAQLPIVLVTALESRQDKERGIRVGANAYVQKSGFSQSNLMEIVRRLT